MSASLVTGAPAARAQYFSLDRESPSVVNGYCECGIQLYPVTEGDILIPHSIGVRINPTFPCASPLPFCTFTPGDEGPGSPQVYIYDAGPGGPLNLGLHDVLGCHDMGCPDVPPGPCNVEVDALSSGLDGLGEAFKPGAIKFSVDRLSTGVDHNGGLTVMQYRCVPSVNSEAPTLEAHADVFATVMALSTHPLHFTNPWTLEPLGNVGCVDGEGCRNTVNGYQYPGAGQIERPTIPDSGDNIDALEVEEFDIPSGCPVYFSLDPASAATNGVSPADILEAYVMVGGFGVRWQAHELGLDPDDDDVDAIAIGLLETAPGDACRLPASVNPVGILFSVSRDSAIVGQPDSRFGAPIMPGDVLGVPSTTPMSNGKPSIYIPAEMLGLVADRNFQAIVVDDLDAMAFNWHPMATIVDCTAPNGNGIEDAAEIALGLEDDCDANGIPDSCEIADDPALDQIPMGGDGVLDQCQTTDQDPMDPDTYCFGNGSGSACPCGNNSAPTSEEGCVNSTTIGALLSGYGSRWIANQSCLPATGPGAGNLSRLVLSATQMPPNEICIFYQGDAIENSGNGSPLGAGLLCTNSNTMKIEAVTTDSAGTASTAVNIVSAGGIQVGDTKYYQARYRDPAGPPGTTNCSAGFNLSNGLRITWDPPK